MTLQSFIQEVIDEVTVSGMIPVPVNPKEIQRNIRTACKWMWDNYQNAVETHYYVIKLAEFQTSDFRSNNMRKILMPECVHSIYGCKEITGMGRMGNIDKDFAEDRLIASEIFISAAHSDGLVMRTAQSMYYDLTKAFQLDNIAFQFNNNTNALTILGRDPRHDVLITAYNKIPPESLTNDYYFQRYVTCLSKLSVARMIGYVDLKLAGNHQINVDQIRSEATEELNEIKEKINSENSPDWFFIFH